MPDKMRKIFSIYSRDFYLFSFLLIFSTIVILFINNATMAHSKHFLEITETEATKISTELYHVESNFRVYSDYVRESVLAQYENPEVDFDLFLREMAKHAQLFLHMSDRKVDGLVFGIAEQNTPENVQFYFAESRIVEGSEAPIIAEESHSSVSLSGSSTDFASHSVTVSAPQEEIVYVAQDPNTFRYKSSNQSWLNLYLDDTLQARIMNLDELAKNEDHIFYFGFTVDMDRILRELNLDYYNESLIFTLLNRNISLFYPYEHADWQNRDFYETPYEAFIAYLKWEPVFDESGSMEWKHVWDERISAIMFDASIVNAYEESHLSRIFRKDVEGTNWTYAHAELITGHKLISAHQTDAVATLVNTSIYVMTFSALLCLWLVQKNLKTNKAPFEYFSEWLMKKYSPSLTQLERNGNHAAHVIHFGLALVILFYTLYAVATGLDLITILVHLVLLALVIFTLRIYRKRMVSKWALNTFATTLLVVPLLLHLFEGGFSGKNPGASLIWMCTGILMILFMYGNVSARNTFRMFILLIFADSLIEINLLGNNNYHMIFSFTSGLFVLGFCLYAAVGHYVAKSHEDYDEINHLLQRLKESQEEAVEQQKMIVLGQLIAGIAHEINTPIGAIKASGEQIESYFFENFRFIFSSTKSFTEREFDILYDLIEGAKSALAEMKSTSEVRMAKRKLIAQFQEWGVPNGQKLAERFCLLELCDIAFFEARKDILFQERISLILDVIVKLSPVITGAQTILFASGKVSKIVFALKSYAHTSERDERILFDLMTSINNVLILYNNQIKKEVQVIQNIPHDIPKIIGNPDEISQVWSNFIHNALYAMNYQGTITIDISVLEDSVRISFSDTGSGIAPENITKVFKTFYTTKPAGEGSGLGLDISKKIIESHNGKIWLESQQGVGTTFYVQLPIA